MSDVDAFAGRLLPAARRAGLSDVDLANLVRFRIRCGAFPAEIDEWLGDSMAARELARALALRFDNLSMATTALLLDRVHEPLAERQLGFSEVLRLHPSNADPAFEARPVPREQLRAVALPEGEEAAGFRAAYSNPTEAWRSLWQSFVADYQPWTDDFTTPISRRGLLKSDVDADCLARIAWRAGLHLRFSKRHLNGRRLVKGWNSAPRGFLLFDWLGAGPLLPHESDARVVVVEAAKESVDELWSHVVHAQVLELDSELPFVSPQNEAGGWLRDLNRFALLAGNVPAEWPRLEREALRALDASIPAVVQAGLWAASFLPTPYSSELRAAFVPFEQHADPVTRDLAAALRSRER